MSARRIEKLFPKGGMTRQRRTAGGNTAGNDQIGRKAGQSQMAAGPAIKTGELKTSTGVCKARISGNSGWFQHTAGQKFMQQRQPRSAQDILAPGIGQPLAGCREIAESPLSRVCKSECRVPAL